MTTLERVPTLLPDVRRLLVLPVVCGVALGVGDLVVMTHVTSPWALLANSSAVWAAAAFALGAHLGGDPARAAVAGAVMLVVAVEAYYAYAATIGLAGYATLTSPVARSWVVFGVLAGTAFGVAGAWTAGTCWWQRVLGAAAGAGVLVGEAVHTWVLGAHAAGTFTGWERSAVLMVLLGGVLLVVTSRTPRVLVPAALATVPVSLFCAAAFTAVGIAY
jgi:hypothetical protein